MQYQAANFEWIVKAVQWGQQLCDAVGGPTRKVTFNPVASLLLMNVCLRKIAPQNAMVGLNGQNWSDWNRPNAYGENSRFLKNREWGALDWWFVVFATAAPSEASARIFGTLVEVKSGAEKADKQEIAIHHCSVETMKRRALKLRCVSVRCLRSLVDAQ